MVLYTGKRRSDTDEVIGGEVQDQGGRPQGRRGAVMVRIVTGAAAVVALVAVLVLCAAALQSTTLALPSDLTTLAEARGENEEHSKHLSAHTQAQAANAYPRATDFLQPLDSGADAAQRGTESGNSPAGGFGSDKVWPAKQVFHSYAVFGSDNHFGPLSHFKQGSHFEDGNDFEEGTSFGMDSHFGADNHFGKDTTVGKGSTVGAGAVFGDGTVMGQESVFGPGVTIGDQSYIAGNQVFAGGDHFGAGISFGPNIRFGPNTEFDGDELFAAGSSFGDGTKFDWAGAGKDTFGGRHHFGVNTVWGDNEPQVSGGGPIRSPGAGEAGVSNGVVVGLPPGYQPTSIPGVYQYSAAPSPVVERRAPREPDPEWHRQEPQNGERTGWEWSQPRATAAAGAAKGAKDRKTLVARRQEKLARRGRVQAQTGVRWSREKWEVTKAARAMAAAAGAAAGQVAAASRLAHAARARGPKSPFGSGMARWLTSHAHAVSGPSTYLASKAAKQHLNAKVWKSADKKAPPHEKTQRRGTKTTVDSTHLDGIADKRVPVAHVQHPKGRSVSFFSMFE